jgi:hypothetical protein
LALALLLCLLKWSQHYGRTPIQQVASVAPAQGVSAKRMPRRVCNLAFEQRPHWDKAFKLREDIIYFGMTNAISGLQGRLQQFDNTISGKRRAHGGADRARYGYTSYARLAPLVYVSIARFACDPTSDLPADLRKMGRVARFEYLCLAVFVERFGCLPRFNDKANAPKYSKRVAT